VGSVAFDTIETPGRRVDRALGGSATYFSVAASCFVPVGLVAVVGDDFLDDHRAVLVSRGIDLEGLAVVKGGKTFFWHGRYGLDPNERESIATELNVFENFRPELPSSYRDRKWIFLGNIDPEIQLEVLEQSSGESFIGCDTMNYWIDRKPEGLREVLKRTDMLFVNDEEARFLSGKSNLVKAGKEILKMGPRGVIVKKGEHGAFLLMDDFIFYAPAYPLEDVTDPTGAGDSFAGGFMGALAAAGEPKGETFRKAMVFATASASFTCQDFSIDGLKNLTREKLEERAGELAGLVAV